MAGFVRQPFGSFPFLRVCLFWHVGLPGFWGFSWFILFLIISFGRFQYFNLHFGSLKLCFTNLVLEIQDNLSLIFLSSLEISNLIYFTHFRLSIIMGHISKFVQAQVCPICQNLINPKQSGYDFMATFRLVRSRVLGGLMV